MTTPACLYWFVGYILYSYSVYAQTNRLNKLKIVPQLYEDADQALEKLQYLLRKLNDANFY